MSHCLSQRSRNMCVWKKRRARSQRNAATVLHLWPLKSRAGNLNWQTSCCFQLGQLGGGALDSVAQQRHPVTRTKHDSNMRDYFCSFYFKCTRQQQQQQQHFYRHWQQRDKIPTLAATAAHRRWWAAFSLKVHIKKTHRVQIQWMKSHQKFTVRDMHCLSASNNYKKTHTMNSFNSLSQWFKGQSDIICELM